MMSLDQIDKMNHNHGSTPSETEESRHTESQEILVTDVNLSSSSISEHPPLNEEDQDKPKGHPLSIEDFSIRFEKAATLEEKLKETIQFMKESLSIAEVPFFKGFWEARSRCLLLFKEQLAPQVRTDYWSEYKQLCEEARRLKEILDEQSAFASEQIEIAITALESEIEHSSEQLNRLKPLEFPIPSATLEKKKSLYNSLQSELTLLNNFAARINGLRKELIKTEMRIRVKNKFFKHLSAAGDHVFPKRKELIKSLSAQFLEDIDQFVKEEFSASSFSKPLHYLRNEIKALQAFAKILTLNTYSFTQTRTRLSECWDKVKESEKERKKVRLEQRSLSKEQAEEVSAKIEELSQGIASGQINISNINQHVDEIFNFMQTFQLDREDKQELREKIYQVRQPLLDQMKQAEVERQQKAQELDRLKMEKIKDLRSRTEDLLKKAESLNPDALQEARESLLKEIQDAPILKAEKLNLEKSLKSLKDVISEKKEKTLLSLSKDARESLDQLYEILNQRKQRRKEIKDRLEEYRKASGGGLSLDFEKALAFNEMIKEEKERLEKINQGIQEIEQKIDELESNA